MVADDGRFGAAIGFVVLTPVAELDIEFGAGDLKDDAAK